MPRRKETFDDDRIRLNFEALETDEADRLKKKLGNIDSSFGFRDGKVGKDKPMKPKKSGFKGFGFKSRDVDVDDDFY